MPDDDAPHIPRFNAAIACGGTGGHLFPGLAVGQELLRRECAVTLMVSPKDVDQQAIRSISDMGVVTLPAVGWQRGGVFGFAIGFCKSYRRAKALYAARPPNFVLAMGGFISAPPICAAWKIGAKTFIHESNTIPGKANRWLSRLVDGAFVYFPQAASLLPAPRVEVVGMPVRPQFLQPMRPAAARTALGLDETNAVLLVMGGSQGARAINELVLATLPQLRAAVPRLQFIHLTGNAGVESARQAYAAQNLRAIVQPFLADMGTALAAADVAVSRAGASSLAELAARQLPAVLIPYPTAADDHQFHNARAFVQSGAARSLPQLTATPEQLARDIIDLLRDPLQRAAMQRALVQWHKPGAAAAIAESILYWPDGRCSPAPSDPDLKTSKMGALNA
jgi:UDP-N-acetylglucosamine--N-acetylmuramyl-(pentapeptide) pyrophosphoryl-undecaprenol N-acetylglucosamine transferase